MAKNEGLKLHLRRLPQDKRAGTEFEEEELTPSKDWRKPIPRIKNHPKKAQLQPFKYPKA